jgi:hypothetical protein
LWNDDQGREANLLVYAGELMNRLGNYLGAHVGWKVARAPSMPKPSGAASRDAASFIGTVKRLFPGAVVE